MTRIDITEYETNNLPRFSIPLKLWQIYWFYQSHTQADSYKICYERTEDRDAVVSPDDIELLAAYGIDFNESTSIISNRRYIVIIPLEDLLDNQRFDSFVKKQRDFDNSEVGIVFVDYGNQSDISDIPDPQRIVIEECVNRAFPNSFIANRELSRFRFDEVSQKPDIKKIVRIDDIMTLDDLVRDNDSFSQTKTLIRSALLLLETARTNQADMIDISDSEIAKRFGLGTQAAVSYIGLMLYGKLLYFGTKSYKVMYSLPGILNKQDAMYADEYINWLGNVPDAAIYNTENENILVFPDKNESRMNRIKMQILECDFDMETERLGTECVTRSYQYGDIKTISAAEMFNLSSQDQNVAKAGMNRLAKLIRDFSYRCNAQDMKSMIFNISNILFYLVDGKMKMGYLAHVSATLPFRAYPIRRKSKPFKINLDLTRDTISDVRLYEDWKEVLAPYVRQGYADARKMFFKPPRYLKGLCLYNLPINHINDGSFTDLTFEAVGMYSNASWSLRRSTKLFDYIKKESIVEKIATPFGGMHPMINTVVQIRREDWRADVDKLQSLNTYVN